MALMKYLLNPESAMKVDPISGTKIQKQAIIQLANSLCHRLLGPNTSDEPMQATDVDIEKPLSMREKLQKAIDAAVAEQTDRDLPKSLAQDFKLFEATTKRSEYLETLFQAALMTAKPTSVESESTFSVGGGFATKICSRLSDKSLSALVMLKAYFKR